MPGVWVLLECLPSSANTTPHHTPLETAGPPALLPFHFLSTPLLSPPLLSSPLLPFPILFPPPFLPFTLTTSPLSSSTSPGFSAIQGVETLLRQLRAPRSPSRCVSWLEEIVKKFINIQMGADRSRGLASGGFYEPSSSLMGCCSWLLVELCVMLTEHVCPADNIPDPGRCNTDRERRRGRERWRAAGEGGGASNRGAGPVTGLLN